jgi:hypothetical protein
MADLDRARDVIEEAGTIERRHTERRRCFVGDKVDCGQCGHPVSAVLRHRYVKQQRPDYRRYRACQKCGAVYQTVERLEKMIDPGTNT